VTDSFEDIEVASDAMRVPAPALVVLPDSDSSTDLTRGLLGCTTLERTVSTARAVGFGHILLGPGTRTDLDLGVPVASGDPVRRPALVVFEGTVLHPELLALMVEHPLESDERYSLFDASNRPAACFIGDLSVVPATMPLAEELPWPEGLGPDDIVRLVYDEDRARAEQLILRGQGLDRGDSGWRRRVEMPALRVLSDSRRPLPQLELVAVALAVGALPLSLLGGSIGVLAGALSLLAGVVLAAVLPSVRALREATWAPPRAPEPIVLAPDGRVTVRPRVGDAAPRSVAPEGLGGDRLAAATRPLGQAALTAGVTYVIVAEIDRSGVAATVLLAAGFAAALLCLFQARQRLRGRPAEVFALPDAHAVAGRLGVVWPAALEGAPVLEGMAVLASSTTLAELTWSVMIAGALARLWRWFSGPGDLLPRRDPALGTTARGSSEDSPSAPP
jgi:hypothetical protein